MNRLGPILAHARSVFSATPNELYIVEQVARMSIAKINAARSDLELNPHSGLLFTSPLAPRALSIAATCIQRHLQGLHSIPPTAGSHSQFPRECAETSLVIYHDYNHASMQKHGGAVGNHYGPRRVPPYQPSPHDLYNRNRDDCTQEFHNVLGDLAHRGVSMIFIANGVSRTWNPEIRRQLHMLTTSLTNAVFLSDTVPGAIALYDTFGLNSTKITKVRG